MSATDDFQGVDDFRSLLAAAAAAAPSARPRVLVAGIGNIFFADDGFGPEVATRLGAEELPDWVKVEDFGIRSIHLAYELMEGYDELVLIDATPRREDKPGTVYLIEPDLSNLDATLLDAHTMNPVTVFSMLDNLGGQPPKTVVVGVEPLSDDEEIGLSPPVAAAVDEAVRLVKEVLAAMPYGANGNGSALRGTSSPPEGSGGDQASNPQARRPSAQPGRGPSRGQTGVRGSSNPRSAAEGSGCGSPGEAGLGLEGRGPSFGQTGSAGPATPPQE